mmetsp:Transcript_7849/g.19503  ORF Transcript_7849/g.19503 Transcript_7849/m.19503 type:complete len:202 (-) Transcript_7849:166-771(-)
MAVCAPRTHRSQRCRGPRKGSASAPAARTAVSIFPATARATHGFPVCRGPECLVAVLVLAIATDVAAWEKSACAPVEREHDYGSTNSIRILDQARVVRRERRDIQPLAFLQPPERRLAPFHPHLRLIAAARNLHFSAVLDHPLDGRESALAQLERSRHQARGLYRGPRFRQRRHQQLWQRPVELLNRHTAPSSASSRASSR